VACRLEGRFGGEHAGGRIVSVSREIGRSAERNKKTNAKRNERIEIK
jgi:hypothetical protein